MKKAIQIFIPIILTLLIILCMIWYLFVYDRDFTRDMLLSCARYCEEQGSHSVAAWFYDRAYSHSGDNDAVAIELANQYKASGNYTKAEYTLSNAIYDGGGIDLYIALCKTYVEQDKLLDAVNMLGSITNPEIKAQLEQLRPQAPTAVPDPGFYSQYISVALQAETGTLYATSNGEYPSTKNDPYSQAIPLSDGENTIIALTVGDSGLVSPLAIFGYTIGGVVEKVSFTDPAIESAVRTALGVDTEDTVYTNDLWSITSFTVPAEAASYADLKYLTYLESLTIEAINAAEFHSLSSLSALTELSISGVSVSQEDLSVIAALPKLQKLTLSNCSLSSIVPLEPLAGLIYLDLSNNTIRNLAPLSGMKQLQELNLQHNAVTDLSDIASLSALTRLDVSFNSLASVAPICGSTSLTWLDASNNQITELGNLNKLTLLTYLSLGYNDLTDIGVVSACTALTDLYISNNALTDITSLSPLTKLMYLDFSYNQITALPEWPVDCALVGIDGAHNLLQSVDSLAGLKQLNNVFMEYNTELASVEALASCPMLIEVDVTGTLIVDRKDVTALTNQNIIVIGPIDQE